MINLPMGTTLYAPQNTIYHHFDGAETVIYFNSEWIVNKTIDAIVPFIPYTFRFDEAGNGILLFEDTPPYSLFMKITLRDTK